MEDRRLNNRGLGRRGWQFVFVALCAVVTLLFCSKISAVLNPVLIAFLIAYIFDPVIHWFELRGFPRWSGIVIIFMVISACIINTLLICVPLIFQQTATLSYDIVGDKVLSLEEQDAHETVIAPYRTHAEPFEDRNENDVYDAAEAYEDTNENGQWDSDEAYTDSDGDGSYSGAESYQDLNGSGSYSSVIVYLDGNGNGRYDAGYLERFSAVLQSGLTVVNARLQAMGAEKIKVDTLMDKLKVHLRSNFKGIASHGMEFVGNTIELIGAGVNLLIFLLTIFMLVPFYTYFIMAEMPKLRHLIVDHLPYEYKDQILETLHKIHAAVSGFFRGMLFVCTVKALVYVFVFWILGMPYYWVFGTLAGYFTIIPIFGVPIVMAPAFLISYAEMGFSGAFIALLVLYVVIEILDGSVMQPIVLGRSVALHPMIILVSVFVGGELAGLFGMLVSVPVAAVVKILIADYVLPHLHEISKPEQKVQSR